MTIIKQISIVLILTSAVIACRKDKIPGVSLDNDEASWVDTLHCEDYSDSIYIYSHAWGRYQYKAPYFNPNNSNEFVYSYIDFETNTKQLIKYNFLTKQKQVLTNSGVYEQPKWGTNGKIAFSDLHHVYVIDENGGDANRVSTNEQNTFPFWYDDNLFWKHYNPNGSGLYQIKHNFSESIIDTISSSFAVNHTDILNDKLLSWFNLEPESILYYGFFNLISQSMLDRDSAVIVKEFSKSITGISWHPSGDYFYSSTRFQNNGNGGLYKITLSGHEEKIMDFCQSKQYSNISCSMDGEYIIGERTAAQLEQYDAYSGRIIQNSTIWLINTETLEETKIEL